METERYPAGTRVMKCNSEPGKDGHADGALATVISSIGPIKSGPYKGQYGYSVYWDDFDQPVFVSGSRIKRLE